MEAPRQREQPGQDRQILGGQRVAAGAERIERLAVAEEDRGLVLAHDELGAHLDVARAALRVALHDAGAGLVEPLDDFHHDR